MARTLVENLTYWVDKDTSGKFEVERVTMTGNKHGADTICSFFYLMVRCSDSQMFTFWTLWRSEDYLPIFTLWLDLIPQGLDVVSNLWDVNLIEQLMTMMVEYIDACDDFYLHAIDNNDLRIDVLLIVTRQNQQPDSCHTWREPTKPTTWECKDLWKRRGSPWIKTRTICL